MTYAWYGHLKHRHVSLPLVIVTSWGIAFFEYCLQVPANRIGHTIYSAPQLKIIQEVLSFAVFILFSWYYLGERPTFYDNLAVVLIMAAVLISLFQPKM